MLRALKAAREQERAQAEVAAVFPPTDRELHPNYRDLPPDVAHSYALVIKEREDDRAAARALRRAICEAFAPPLRRVLDVLTRAKREEGSA